MRRIVIIKIAIVGFFLVFLNSFVLGQNYCDLHYCIADFLTKKDVHAKMDSIVFNENNPIILVNQVVCSKDTFDLGLLNKVERSGKQPAEIKVAHCVAIENNKVNWVSIEYIDTSKSAYTFKLKVHNSKYSYLFSLKYLKKDNDELQLEKWSQKRQPFNYKAYYGENADIEESKRLNKIFSEVYYKHTKNGIFKCSF